MDNTDTMATTRKMALTNPRLVFLAEQLWESSGDCWGLSRTHTRFAEHGADARQPRLCTDIKYQSTAFLSSGGVRPSVQLLRLASSTGEPARHPIFDKTHHIDGRDTRCQARHYIILETSPWLYPPWPVVSTTGREGWMDGSRFT